MPGKFSGMQPDGHCPAAGHQHFPGNVKKKFHGFVLPAGFYQHQPLVVPCQRITRVNRQRFIKGADRFFRLPDF
jgi:hypothetical protein